jgi:hypothetical protein
MPNPGNTIKLMRSVLGIPPCARQPATKYISGAIMIEWNKYTNEELETILDSHKNAAYEAFYAAEERVWNENNAGTYEKSVSLQQIRQLTRRMTIKNKITHSFFSSINDLPSYAIMTLIAIADVANLAVLSLLAITATLLAATLITGALYFISSYQEQKKQSMKNQRMFDILVIKKKCTEELIRRANPSDDIILPLLISSRPTLSLNHDDANKIVVNDNFKYTQTTKLKRVKPAIGAGVMIGSILLSTYYLGASTIITAFGAATAASAMLGPIGLGVALGVTIGIAIFYAVVHYRSSIDEHKTLKYIAHLEKDLQKSTDELESFQNGKEHKPRKTQTQSEEDETPNYEPRQSKKAVLLNGGLMFAPGANKGQTNHGHHSADIHIDRPNNAVQGTSH